MFKDSTRGDPDFIWVVLVILLIIFFF